MGKSIACFLILISLLAGFGYFYMQEYYPLRAELFEYKEENRTLLSVINELKKDLEQGDSVVMKPAEDYVAQDMRDMIDGIEVEQVREEISIILPGKKLFPPGSVELSQEGKDMLFKIANILKELKGRKIMIEGHTDNTKISGSLKKEYPTNWDLSAKRAVNVIKYLISEVGMNPENLSAVAYGEYHPVVSNDTKEGRNKNRRIVIDVLPR
ncbi:flagellar motor protein MotB [candidate division WOR-3 bacterium]|nr:flagellar motor protein MotB [candidate division WOR-3 bacterium]